MRRQSDLMPSLTFFLHRGGMRPPKATLEIRCRLLVSMQPHGGWHLRGGWDRTYNFLEKGFADPPPARPPLPRFAHLGSAPSHRCPQSVCSPQHRHNGNCPRCSCTARSLLDTPLSHTRPHLEGGQRGIRALTARAAPYMQYP